MEITNTVEELVALATLVRALGEEDGNALDESDRERITSHLRRELAGLRTRIYETSPEEEHGVRRFTGAVATITQVALEARDLDWELRAFPIQAGELLMEAARRWADLPFETALGERS